jgi:putative transposase
MPYKKHKQYRLYGYDYSQNGAYFITIVTKNRIHYFGEIVNGEMQLSPIGKFVEENFSIISDKIKYMQIDEWEILPNHLHLIVSILNKNTEYTPAFGLQPLVKKSVSSFINHLKGTIKRWCNENNFENFAWQARFHDRIIRDAKEYSNISNYIQKNVENWDMDNEIFGRNTP